MNSGPSASRVTEDWSASHQPLSCDFAYKGFASASTTRVGRPEGAFDHDPDTFWHTNQSSDGWLQVNLGHNYLLNALAVNWTWDASSQSTAESAVLTSLDGVHWSHLIFVASSSAQNGVPHRIWFPQRVARFVRFAGTDWLKGWASVRSLELYGPDCPLTVSRLMAPPSAVQDTPEF